MTAGLRCLEERYVIRSVGRRRRTETIVYQLYTETITIPYVNNSINTNLYRVSKKIFIKKKAVVSLVFLNADIANFMKRRILLPISFDLPNEKGYETSLHKRPPQYWELEVKAKTPEIDYQALFLVPVYAKR